MPVEEMSGEERQKFLETFDNLAFRAWESGIDKKAYSATLIQRIDARWAEFEAAKKSYEQLKKAEQC